jgi:hypothetical protein
MTGDFTGIGNVPTGGAAMIKGQRLGTIRHSAIG